MKCSECQELLVARIDGTLDEPSVATVTEHLLACSDCRLVLESFTRLHERLNRFGKAPDRDRLEDQMMGQVMGLQTLRPHRQVMSPKYVKVGLGMAAAILLVAGLTAVLWTPSRRAQGGVVLADVIEHMRSSHTVTWKSLFYTEGQLVGTAEQMYKEGYRYRTATSDGHIYIQDMSRGRTLALNPNKGTATFLDMMPTHFDFYRFVTSFQAGTEQSLGTDVIGGRQAIGFAVHPDQGDFSIWVDPQTQLPVQIREEATDRNGKEEKIIATDFAFDMPLDDSLFSLEVPEGYQIGDVESAAIDRAKELALYTRSAAAANRIVKACVRFADEHGGEWPDDLDALRDYGIDAEALVNPRRPDLALGWSYHSPANGKDELADPSNTVLICELFEEWNEGVNVGFADGRVQFVKDPDRLDELVHESHRVHRQ